MNKAYQGQVYRSRYFEGLKDSFEVRATEIKRRESKEETVLVYEVTKNTKILRFWGDRDKFDSVDDFVETVEKYMERLKDE